MPPTFRKGTGREISPLCISCKARACSKGTGQRTKFCFPQALQIAPEQGVMQPGESIPCFITLQPSGIASLCSMDLVCEVRNGGNVCVPITFLLPQPRFAPQVHSQESLRQHERELREWEREKERQAAEFTITEKELRAAKKPRSPAGVSAARILRQLGSSSQGSTRN